MLSTEVEEGLKQQQNSNTQNQENDWTNMDVNVWSFER